MSHAEFLQYVVNTNHGATKADFIEDWEPIGERVWDELWSAELIEFDKKLRVVLTKRGLKYLAGSPKKEGKKEGRLDSE